MWVEKYRPTKLSDLINQKETVSSLKSLLKNQSEMPHLLFSGNAGVGKTTTALCLSREILGDRFNDYVLELNASDERGINMVRERVKKFSRFAGLDTEIPFKIIILDEADEMTSDAQTALRRIIEDTAKYCRFILIANNISKIIAPIQSRCAVFKFTKIDEKEISTYLKSLATKEKVKVDEKSLKSIADFSGGDLRQSINLLQAAASSGTVTESKVKSVTGSAKSKDVEKILKLSLDGKILDARNQMIELIKVYGMSETDFLKYLNQSVFSLKIKNLEDVLEIIAKYDYRILVGSNPEIQISALLAEISKFGK
jgi:replication factor C small subunit